MHLAKIYSKKKNTSEREGNMVASIFEENGYSACYPNFVPTAKQTGYAFGGLQLYYAPSERKDRPVGVRWELHVAEIKSVSPSSVHFADTERTNLGSIIGTYFSEEIERSLIDEVRKLLSKSDSGNFSFEHQKISQEPLLQFLEDNYLLIPDDLDHTIPNLILKEFLSGVSLLQKH